MRSTRGTLAGRSASVGRTKGKRRGVERDDSAGPQFARGRIRTRPASSPEPPTKSR